MSYANDANTTSSGVPEPDFRVVKLNQTDMWNDGIQKELKGGKIWAIFLFDKNQETYCCELTPSYCLHWICDEAEMGDGSRVGDDLREKISLAGVDDPVTYMHCRIIDKFPEDRFRKVKLDEPFDPAKHESREDWYKDEFESALEYARCNSPI